MQERDERSSLHSSGGMSSVTAAGLGELVRMGVGVCVRVAWSPNQCIKLPGECVLVCGQVH